MTGKIVLDGAPTADLHPSTKKYVDDSIPTVPTVPDRASQADIDAETDNDGYVSVLGVFRAIARKVKNATTAVRGIVLLARNADVDATETDTSRVTTVATAKRLFTRLGNALVPAVFRTGNTDRISGAKLGSGTRDGTRFLRDDNVWAEIADSSGALMEQLFNDHTSAIMREQRIGTFVVPNDNNTVLLVSVNGIVEFFAGDDFSRLRASDATMVNGITVYSNASRHFLVTQPTNTSRLVRIWIVEDVQAFASIAERFLPTMTQADAEAGTSTQRRIVTAQRLLQAIQANRNPDAFTGVTEASGELTFTREGGTNPVDVPITGAGGAFELRPYGSATVTLASTLKATGITPPALDDDEAFYLRLSAPDEDEPPQYFVMRGATYDALTVAAVGDSPSGTQWSRTLPVTVGTAIFQKTAAGELLVAEADGALDGSDLVIETFTVSVGMGGSLGHIPLGSTNIDFSAANTLTAPTAGQPDIDLSSVLPDDILGVRIDYSAQDVTFDDIRMIDASMLLSKNAGATLSSAEQAKPTLGGIATIFGTNIWLSKDSDGNLAAAAGGTAVDAMPITVWRFGRATAVAANPAGTDGDTLRRLRVQGRNYNLPPSGYLFYTRPTLTIPADITTAGTVQEAGRTFTLLNAAVPGRVYKDTDFTSEWFGNLEIDGDGNGGDGNNTRILEYVLKTTHTFNGKTIVHSRVERETVPRNFTSSFFMGKLSAVSSIPVGSFTDEENNVTTITEADLEGPVTIRFDLSVKGLQQNGQQADFSYDEIRFSHVQYRAYQIDHGEGSGAIPTSQHNRYIGWSLAQNPTGTEFGTFESDTDDTLDVPALPAAFTAAGGAFLIIAVPKSQGVPTGFYRSGNPINVIGSWDRVNDWTPQGSTPHYVYATEVAQSATSLAGAFYRIEYGGTV